jgi:hypothetical protein
MGTATSECLDQERDEGLFVPALPSAWGQFVNQASHRFGRRFSAAFASRAPGRQDIFQSNTPTMVYLTIARRMYAGGYHEPHLLGRVFLLRWKLPASTLLTGVYHRDGVLFGERGNLYLDRAHAFFRYGQVVDQ